MLTCGEAGASLLLLKLHLHPGFWRYYGYYSSGEKRDPERLGQTINYQSWGDGEGAPRPVQHRPCHRLPDWIVWLRVYLSIWMFVAVGAGWASTHLASREGTFGTRLLGIIWVLCFRCHPLPSPFPNLDWDQQYRSHQRMTPVRRLGLGGRVWLAILLHKTISNSCLLSMVMYVCRYCPFLFFHTRYIFPWIVML